MSEHVCPAIAPALIRYVVRRVRRNGRRPAKTTGLDATSIEALRLCVAPEPACTFVYEP
jgi:hypothetical protein